MATINEPQQSAARQRSACRVKRYSVKTDMTPMVDLGFLLIAFFVMTAEMSRPAVTKLNMPKEQGSPMKLGESNALTLLIGSTQMYYYRGDWAKARTGGSIRATDFSLKSGIGQQIREQQAWLEKNFASGEGKDGLMFLIKPGPDASYSQLVDALDEAQINAVRKYMVVRPDAEELDFLKNAAAKPE